MIAILGSNVKEPIGNSPSDHRALLAMGLRNNGVECVEIIGTIPPPNCKTVACWGWKRGKALRDKGYNVLIMERGYIGDRFKYTSLGWNGLNNYATFPSYPDDGGERFNKHGGIIKPWKRHGEYILILGQVRGDASLKDYDVSRWYGEIAIKAKEIYNLPVYFRPHPESVRRGGYFSVNGIENMGGSLQEAMSGALFTIAYNSNSCLDSILSGVPCFAGDRGTMAWELCMPKINELIYPERERIAHSIAWTQWTQEEISSGFALKGLFE